MFYFHFLYGNHKVGNSLVGTVGVVCRNFHTVFVERLESDILGLGRLSGNFYSVEFSRRYGNYESSILNGKRSIASGIVYRNYGRSLAEVARKLILFDDAVFAAVIIVSRNGEVGLDAVERGVGINGKTVLYEYRFDRSEFDKYDIDRKVIGDSLVGKIVDIEYFCACCNFAFDSHKLRRDCFDKRTVIVNTRDVEAVFNIVEREARIYRNAVLDLSRNALECDCCYAQAVIARKRLVVFGIRRNELPSVFALAELQNAVRPYDIT